MSDQTTNQLLERLLEQQNAILEQLQNNRPQPAHKDFYDRLGAWAPLLSAAIIACTGAYFTYSYNQQQLHVQQIQTIEKFFPHLVGDEKSKRAAILAMNSLGNPKLAAKVASIFASEGTASALTSLAKSSDTEDKETVRDALYRTLDALAEKYRYDNRLDEAVETYKKAIDIKASIIGKDSPALKPDLDKLADLYQKQGARDAAEQARTRAATLVRPSGIEQPAAAAEENGNATAQPIDTAAKSDNPDL